MGHAIRFLLELIVRFADSQFPLKHTG